MARPLRLDPAPGPMACCLTNASYCVCVCVCVCVGASVHTRGCSGERVWGSDPDHLHSATENICHLRYYAPVSVCMLGKYIWALFLNLSQSALLAHSYLGHCACMKSHTIRT